MHSPSLRRLEYRRKCFFYQSLFFGTKFGTTTTQRPPSCIPTAAQFRRPEIATLFRVDSFRPINPYSV
ncbi:hypothetical protein BVI434_1110008 [Burkholderia vietnamiensis]|nr:hypothetical protein BVI434_1110008 [Burkholderia vietnamiensis]